MAHKFGVLSSASVRLSDDIQTQLSQEIHRGSLILSRLSFFGGLQISSLVNPASSYLSLDLLPSRGLLSGMSRCIADVARHLPTKESASD